MVLNLLELLHKSGTNIRVFETRAASISGENVPVEELIQLEEMI